MPLRGGSAETEMHPQTAIVEIGSTGQNTHMRNLRFQFRISHLLWAVFATAVLVRFPIILLVALILAGPFIFFGLCLGVIFSPLFAYLTFIEKVEFHQSIEFSDSAVAAGGTACLLLGIALFAAIGVLVMTL